MSKKQVNAYCVVCKQQMPVHQAQILTTANGKYRLAGKCSNGHKMSKFVAKKDVSGDGILGSLLGFKDGKIPLLSDLPLVGSLL